MLQGTVVTKLGKLGKGGQGSVDEAEVSFSAAVKTAINAEHGGDLDVEAAALAALPRYYLMIEANGWHRDQETNEDMLVLELCEQSLDTVLKCAFATCLFTRLTDYYSSDDCNGLKVS